MTIYLGADHGGFALKEYLKTWLTTQGYQVKDCGAHEFEAQDDYPDYAFLVSTAVSHDAANNGNNGVAGDVNNESKGILCCRSGGGMIIAANKMKNIRAVYVPTPQEATLAREKNNANIISLAADVIDKKTAQDIVQTFLETPFSKEDRHVRRLAKIHAYEHDLL